jgi:hypothetical protein
VPEPIATTVPPDAAAASDVLVGIYRNESDEAGRDRAVGAVRDLPGWQTQSRNGGLRQNPPNPRRFARLPIPQGRRDRFGQLNQIRRQN